MYVNMYFKFECKILENEDCLRFVLDVGNLNYLTMQVHKFIAKYKLIHILCRFGRENVLEF